MRLTIEIVCKDLGLAEEDLFRNLARILTDYMPKLPAVATQPVKLYDLDANCVGRIVFSFRKEGGT